MSTSSGKTGRCLCGKIEYELKGPSATPLYNTVCHCLNCRRVSGTAFYTASICPKEVREPTILSRSTQPALHVPQHDAFELQHVVNLWVDNLSPQGFSVTKGAEYQKDYWDTNTDSGTNLRRVFCTECGTKLFAFTPLWDEIVSVAAGTLDDFDSWRPDTEQYCIHRAAFVDKAKGVERERSFKLAVKGGEVE